MTWDSCPLQAITEEIKPILGRDMPNGHPAMRGGKKSNDVKIDQKALDEVGGRLM